MRKEWQITVEAGELGELAQARLNHHKQRLGYWDGVRDHKQQEYIESVRTSAEKATEREQEEARKLIEQYQHQHSSTTVVGRGVNVQGDPEVHQDLQNAIQKVREHGEKVRTFERWVVFLDRMRPDCWLPIDIEDANFFDLRKVRNV